MLATLNKVITKISLLHEGDAVMFIANADKPIVTSNVVNKVIEVIVGKDPNLGNVNVK